MWTPSARIAGFALRQCARTSTPDSTVRCERFTARASSTSEAYVRNLRVERAKQLLDSTELSIEKVAQLSGFALRPHFHRVFRRAVGTTPAQYRRRMESY